MSESGTSILICVRLRIKSICKCLFVIESTNFLPKVNSNQIRNLVFSLEMGRYNFI